MNDHTLIDEWRSQQEKTRDNCQDAAIMIRRQTQKIIAKIAAYMRSQTETKDVNVDITE
jgi:hypothetical protein